MTQPVALVASASVSSAISCNGDTDGSVTASQTGGTSAYTYSWNTGGTAAIETGLGAGTYSVTITDANGCTDSASVVLTQPVALVASASVSSSISCNGDTDGSVTASQTGGTSAYTYSWNTGGTAALETGLGVGTYSVTITDANGCTDSSSVVLTQPAVLVSSASVTSIISCNGVSDGQVTATQTGGTSAYTYSWNDGQTTATATSLSAGTYSVTITDANGCTDSSSVVLTQPAVLVSSASVTSTLDCNGDSDGQVTASQTGGTSAYTYSWNDGQTTATATSLSAGTYSVTITDANGCTDSSSVVLTQPAVLVSSASVTSTLDCNGDSDGQVTASQTGGTSAYTYSWNDGQTTATATSLSAGTYSVTITDANGCTDSSSVVLTQPAVLMSSASVTSTLDCNGDSDGQVTASQTGGTSAYTYSWNDGQTTATATSLSAGTYSVTVTDANGCTDSSSVVLTQPAVLVSSASVTSTLDCNGDSDGQVTASQTGGTSAYTYSWNDGQTTATATSLSAGTYSVTITDANGCTDSSSVVLTQPAVLVSSASVTSTLDCNGDSDGQVTASQTGGTSAYTYSWNDGQTTATATSLSAGTYSVTITDANGCTDSSSVVLTQPAVLVSSASVTSTLDCNGDSDGQVTATQTGGTSAYTYSWNDGQTTATATSLSAGTYSVTITDANGCTDSSSVVLTQPAVLVSSASVTSTLDCNGDSDGQVTATQTGGTSAYTYSWNDGQTTATATSLSAGTYSVTITDANGCTDSSSVVLTQPAVLMSSASVTSTLDCNGDSDGQVTASQTGGTSAYTYSWNDGQTTATATSLSAGTYSVTVTDANGCTDSSSVVLTQPAVLVSSASVTSTLDCNGDSDGQVTASQTGGTSAYTYSWNDGQTTATATSLSAGTYSVTVTDANGCTDSSSVVLTQPAVLVSSASVTSTLDCNGDSDGQVTASQTGGTSAYTYSWNDGQTTATATSLSAGTYSVTITDANGCTDSSSVVLTQPAVLVSSASVTSTLDCNGDSDGQVTASQTGGTSAYTYSWNDGQTTATATSLSAGTYSVTITDANGCTDSSSVVLTQPAVLVSSASVTSTLDCNGDSDGQVTASQTGGTSAYTYSWNDGQTTATATSLSAGTYSVTITDANGCTDSSSVVLTQPAVLVSSASVTSTLDCNGDSDGQVTASQTGGTSAYTYSWNDGQTTATATSLSAGTYSVTITDANGCTDSSSVVLTQPAVLVSSASVTSTLDCNGDSDGQVTASQTGGTSAYTYSWNDGQTTATATSLSAGTYSVTITDANGCTDSSSVVLTQPAVLVSSASVTSTLDCNGDSDGQVTASQTGGTSAYTYSWNDGQTTATATSLSAGTYSVTITDANGCTDSSSVVLTQPAVLVSSASVTSTLDCNGDSDGQVTASQTGGTSAYTYSWNDGQTTATATSLSAGTYSVTVTDANGCTDSSSVVLTQPAVLVSSASVTSTLDCNGDSDGQVTASQTGGTSAYTYSWNDGQTTATATSLSAGTYSVTITDANGCTDSSSVVLTQPAVLVSSASVTSTLDCNGDSDGQVTASQTGGTSAYTYSWNDGQTTATATSLSAGTYSVTVTDANGCTDSSSVVLTQPAVLVSSASVTSTLDCNGDSDGQVTASQTGGTSAYTYSWNDGQTTATATSLSAGTYSVTITDANGCTDSSSVVITEPVLLVASTVVDSNVTCTGFSDGGATSSGTGGTMPYTYSWSNSATTASITGVVAGTYSVTVTDNNGCTDSSSVVITQPALLVASTVVDSNVTCTGFSDGGATSSGTGGTMPYTYSWSNSATTASITGVTAGTYSVTITDNNGCTDSSSVVITQPVLLVASTVVDSNVTCNGFSDGGATSSSTGGTMPYTYSWSNSATTASITGVTAGTYSVTITDNNGCTDSSSVVITQPALLVASTVVDSNVTCNGFSDGGATSSSTGGTMPYTYSWSNSATTASITGVTAGTYSVTITDNNGCTDSSSVVITQPALLVALTVVDSNVTCNGFSDGGATSSSTGGTMPYTYSWSNSATTASITGVTAGTYSVTITDNNGCTDSSSVVITQPALLVASTVVDSNVTCNGFSDGGATSSSTGGTMPYTYSWSNSATTASITGVTAGTYSVTITDNNGCTDSSSVVITQPVLLVASTVVDSNVTCNGFSDGGATSSSTGGTMPYTYSWSNSATTASITGVVAGTYSVTITDNNGCTDSSSVVITQPTVIGVSITAQTNVDCNGASTGSATAAGSGGTGAYTYAWSNGATTATNTGLVAGTFTVSVTDANGCGPETTTVTITEPTAVGVSITAQTNVDCNGASTGSATAAGSGGTGAYTYAWSNGATTATNTGLVAGTFTVSVTDANGCGPASTAVTITEPTAVGVSITAQTNVDCNGASTGSATAAGSGGTGAYTYAWSNGATTATNTGLVAGTFTVSVTDANGCGPASTTVTITEPTAVGVSITAQTNVDCNGASTGSATATSSGGTGAHTYLWSTGDTTGMISSLVAGTYTVSVTDANGCGPATTTVTITEPVVLIVSATVDNNVSCNGSNDGGLTANVTGGTGAYSYLWSTGDTTASITGLGGGTYTITVTDANGCLDADIATITEPAFLFANVVVDSNATCNGFADGGLTAAAIGGTMPYTFSWSNSATTASITGVVAGTYTVTITDANGCTDVDLGTVTEPVLLVAAVAVDSNATCNGFADGGLTASATGGTGAYTYAWSNSATTASITGIVAGTFTVTITDANGCVASSTGTVTEPALLVAGVVVDSNATCNGFADGGLTASSTGGTMPYTYSWSNAATTASITGVVAGTYTVTVTDNNGCTGTNSGTVTEPVLLVAGVVVDSNATCNGFADGGLTASATGGTGAYTYAWSNAATTASITGVVAGTYTVTVTDNNGCTGTNSGTVTEPTLLAASVAVDSNATCNGFADGGLTASSTGGTMPYTYSWSNAATTASITGVAAGTFTVTITDANGCVASSTGTVTEPTLLVASVAVDSNATCNGFADGGLTASATGGTGAYTYSWSNSATTASITGIVAGTYTVTITDANGCTGTNSGTVTEPALLTASVVVDSNATCNGFSDGGLTASATGGTGTYTYSWSNAATTASITGLVAGTYTVTITDNNGCTATNSGTVTEPALLVPSITVDSNVTCNGFADGGLTASSTGGTMPYTYSWSNAATTASITGVVAGTYTVTITDNNGCTGTNSGTVTEPTLLAASVAVDSNATCNGFADGGLTAGSTGGTMPYTYSWSNAATTASITGVVAGTYTVTITDNNGCTATNSGTVTEPTLLVASVAVDSNATCNGFADGGLTASATGGTGAYTYSWSNAATTASITGIVAGTYTVTITDANGCTGTNSGTVTEPALLTASVVVDSNATCNGFADGGLTASGTGGTGAYTYAWSNAATTASITGLVAGTYTVTITDNNGCTATNSGTVTEPALLVPSITVDSNVTCNGFADGGLTASLTGGTMPYTYSWSNAATTASITGVVAGTYTVTITDANSCTGISSGTVTEPALLIASVAVDSNATCNGFADGGLTASSTGGTMPYTYSWSNAATTASITGVVAGTYTITITDNNGCTATNSGTVTEPTLLVASVAVDSNATCNGSADGGLTASATGGTGAYTYSWSNSATTASITGIVAGTYTVTITDNNGCTATNSGTVTEPVAVTASVAVDSSSTCGAATGGLTASAMNGVGTLSYLWSNAATTANITGLVGGTYTVTVTDANGCTATQSGVVPVVDCESEISIACACLDNATLFDLDLGVGGDDGQFSELIRVTGLSGAALPSGQQWTVVSSVGGFDAFNIPTVGQQSAGVPIAVGTTQLMYHVPSQTYRLPFVHVDSMGYDIEVEGPYTMGNPANMRLRISNKCQYPDPIFNPVLEDEYCNASDPVSLGGTDTNGNTAEDILFTVDGMITTTLDPAVLSVGFHTILMTFDGADDGNMGLSPDNGVTPASPGCVQVVRKTIEIIDGAVPIITCPADNLGLPLGCNPTLPPAATTFNLITDLNPDPSLPTIDGGCGRSMLTVREDTTTMGCSRTINRVYRITDLSGKFTECTQVFTFPYDETDPVWSQVMPADTLVDCDSIPMVPIVGVDIQATDNCGMPGINYSEMTTQSFNPAFCNHYNYELTRTWVATDSCGNTTTHVQVIQVEDDEAPEFKSTGGLILETSATSCTADFSYQMTADSLMDNCTSFDNLDLIYSVDGGSPRSGTQINETFDLGVHSIAFTATDPCGNISTHVLVIIVEDKTPPIVSCLGTSPIIGLPPNDTLILPPSLIDNGSFDFCGAISLSVSMDTFTCFHADGVTPWPVTLTATDASGNSASCNTTVIIEDNLTPNAVCNPNIELLLDETGAATLTVADVDGGSTDNCSGAANLDFQLSQTDFGVNDLITSPVAVTMTVTDQSGASDDCTTLVNVGIPETCFDVVDNASNTIAGGMSSRVEVPVVVSNFINVESFQFVAVIEEDTVAEFTDLINGSLSSAGLLFNIVSSDTMIITWVNGGGNPPVTFVDGTEVFSFEVLLTGDISENTKIKLIGTLNLPGIVVRSYAGTGIQQQLCAEDGEVLVRDPAQLDIGGDIRTESGSLVALADVELTNVSQATSVGTQTTDGSGLFQFGPVSGGDNYLLRPSKDINWTNGVSSLDLSIILRHIVGLDTLDSPYQKIAADAFRDGTITVFDVVALNVLLASSITGPPITPSNNTSWRFVDADYVFPSTLRNTVPTFPDTIAKTPLTATSLDNDFIAVKIGDVEGNANPLAFDGGGTEGRGDRTLKLLLEEQRLQAGEEYELTFNVEEYRQLLAHQWVLEFDEEALQLLDARAGEESGLEDQHFYLDATDRGQIGMIWYAELPEDLNNGESLFHLKFRAKKDVAQLSDVFSIDQSNLTAAAYTLEREQLKIELSFISGAVNPVFDFQLLQNQPNPFRESTVISFILPSSSSANLTVYDVSGRLLKTISGTYKAGYNEISLQRSELPTAGVLYYKLDTERHSATKRMIVIE